MPTINATLKTIKTKNQFTILEDDNSAVLLFEGKVIFGDSLDNFRCGREHAFFLKKLVKKSWNGPLELYARVKTMIKDPNTLKEYSFAGDQVYKYFTDKDLLNTDDSFYPDNY